LKRVVIFCKVILKRLSEVPPQVDHSNGEWDVCFRCRSRAVHVIARNAKALWTWYSERQST